MSHSLLLCVSLAAAPAPQDVQVLIQEGDPTPDGFVVQFQNEITVGAGGSWVAAVNSTNPDTGVDDFIYRDGGVLISPGDPIPGLGGATLDFFLGIDHAAPGLTAYAATPVQGGDTALIVEDSLIAQEGDAPRAALGLAPGGTWFRIEEVQVRTTGKVCMPASYELPGAAGLQTVIAVYDIDGANQVTNASLPVSQGMTLADGRIADNVFTGSNETRMNSVGDVLWWGFTGGSGILAINDVVVGEANMPTPEPGLNWRSFTGPEVDLNDNGDWVTRAQVSAFPRDVVMSSNGLVARQSGTHPAYPAFTAIDFGFNAPVFIDNDGVVAFYVELAGTGSTTDNEAYVVGDQMIVREGVTQVGGGTIVEISDGREGFHYARDGSAFIFEGDLDVGGVVRETNFLVTFGVGQSYCIAEINSTGVAASIGAIGSAAAADNGLSVAASDLPQNSFSFFLVSQTQGFVAMPGGSQGNLCLAGDIGRYQNQAMSSGATGTTSLAIDLTDVAGPTGSYAAMPGMTLNFQAWYRDANPGPTSNFTNGVSVVIE